MSESSQTGQSDSPVLAVTALEAQRAILVDLLAAFRGRRSLTATDIAEADSILDMELRAKTAKASVVGSADFVIDARVRVRAHTRQEADQIFGQVLDAYGDRVDCIAWITSGGEAEPWENAYAAELAERIREPMSRFPLSGASEPQPSGQSA